MHRVSMRCCAVHFESDAEAKLVHDLREDGLITLGLVATDDEGQVVGYVAFSPVDVQGEDLQWVGMAPLAVDENYRGRAWRVSWSMKGWIPE
jgi:putative acetyltransferase